jgi:retron-type reverse transcriptase
MVRVINRWTKETKTKGMEYTIIQADIEGGFDKINTKKILEEIPQEYKRWIQSWCAERKGKFRFNGRTSDSHKITAGVPQGSPLSPYLFAIAMKNIAQPNIREHRKHRTMTLSYVDDFTILIGGKTSDERKRETKKEWERIKEKVQEEGMNFADNKTKLFHSDKSRWHITENQKPEQEIRILGYWMGREGVGKNT